MRKESLAGNFISGAMSKASAFGGYGEPISRSPTTSTRSTMGRESSQRVLEPREVRGVLRGDPGPERAHERNRDRRSVFMGSPAKRSGQVQKSREPAGGVKRKPRARYSWNRKHAKCNGSGWVAVMATSKLGGRPMVAVTRCDCWFKISASPQPAKKRKVVKDWKSKASGRD